VTRERLIHMRALADEELTRVQSGIYLRARIKRMRAAMIEMVREIETLQWAVERQAAELIERDLKATGVGGVE